MKDEKEIKSDVESTDEGLGFQRILHPITGSQNPIGVDEEVMEE
jgi:hypothetical protein